PVFYTSRFTPHGSTSSPSRAKPRDVSRGLRSCWSPRPLLIQVWHKRQKPEQDQCSNHSWGSNVFQGIDRTELPPRVSIDEGTRDNPECRSRDVGADIHASQAGDQVHHKKRKERNEPEGHEITECVLPKALLKRTQPLSKPLLHPIAQQVAGYEERDRRACCCPQIYEERTQHSPEEEPACQC